MAANMVGMVLDDEEAAGLYFVLSSHGHHKPLLAARLSLRCRFRAARTEDLEMMPVSQQHGRDSASETGDMRGRDIMGERPPIDPPRRRTPDKPGQMNVHRELYPKCYWHRGCREKPDKPSPPMLVVGHTEDGDLVQCGRCNRIAEYVLTDDRRVRVNEKANKLGS